MPKREWKRENVWLRMLLIAPTGAGKTMGALAVAANLFGGALALVGIDTEHERMKLYADMFGLADYRVISGDYSPEVYIKELNEVEAEHPGGILILDSVSHEWDKTGGVLEIVDKGKGANWKEATPRHDKFTERLAALQMHTIVCCRAKMKYDWTPAAEGGKRVAPQRLGVGPIQRDNFLYDFDIVGDIDLETHQTTFSEKRCRPLAGRTFSLVPDPDDPASGPNEVADILTKWLSEGEPPEPVQVADEGDVDELVGLLISEGITLDKVELGFGRARRENRGQLHPDYIATKLAEARARAVTATRMAETAERQAKAKEAKEEVAK